RGVHTGLHFRLAHSFVGLGFCTSVAHPRSQPSYRHVVFFAVQIPFILLVLPSFAWRTISSSPLSSGL
ncbi:MAG: hypothetical protein IJI54_12945, partial [Kiritimatiellae bacterium]|nr:hypothetical protein [Kiritimatiellia bacterium]